jgi:class 3 adenylate cyclase
VRTCDACGAGNPDEARYCHQCGVALSAPDPVLARGEERRLITMLFADLTDSTGLAGRLDPERLQEVLTAFFGAMRHEIEAEGGIVEKFIGDAVVALFGVPSAHEDDPNRALQSALRMGQALVRLNETLQRTHGLTLAMRMGAHTGEVIAKLDAQPGEVMVTGEAMTVAARLEQAADPGQVLISERLAKMAHGFELVEVGELSLKGKARPVRSFLLVGVEPLSRIELRRFGAPIVGRRREMSQLEAIYQAMAGEFRPALATIYGEAGVGKSRLVAEFIERSSRLPAPPSVVSGRCLPYGEGVTYWPLAEILKQHAGVFDSDPPQLALAKIEGAAGELDLVGETPALCFTVGLQHPAASFDQMEPRQARLEVGSAWVAYFSALARRTPTIVVIEDLHWAGAALLDILEEICGGATGALMFVCTARPELAERRPAWGGGSLSSTSILLEPLTQDESGQLVGLLLPGEELPKRVRERVLERSGGNPFFLEEIVRHLIDESTDAPDKAAAIAKVEIPDTVQGVLTARMDLLGRLERRVLQSAAVVGRSFWPGAVARLLDTDPSRVEESLRRLEERGLVMASLSSAMAGEREYVFRHILTRDVAYESLPRRQRGASHARVAGWIEEATGEREREFVELLAYHYLQAYRALREYAPLDPEGTEDLRTKAFGSCLRASEQVRVLALDKAEHLAEDALSVALDQVERSRAMYAIGEACFFDYRGDEAWRWLRDAIDARVAGDGADLEIASLCARALEVITRGRGAMRSLLSSEEAAPYLATGLAHVGPGDSEELARLLTVKSFWSKSFRESGSTLAELQECREAGQEAAAMALRLGRPDLASAALDGVGSFYVTQGLWGQLGAVVDQRLEVAGGLGDPWEVGDVFAMAAWSSFHVGRYRRSLDSADEGYRRTVSKAQAMALYCLDWRALARYRLGDWDGFFQDVKLAEEMLGERKERPPSFAAEHVGVAAVLHEVRGDGDLADSLLEVLSWLERAEERRSPGWAISRALVLARRGDFAEARAQLESPEVTAVKWGRGWVLEARCDILAEEGAWDDAPQVVEESRTHAQEAGLEALCAYADALDGRRASAEGDIEAGLSLLRSARDRFATLDARWEAARAGLALAQALSKAGRSQGALAELRSPILVFGALGSVRELADSEGLRAAVGRGGR